jgi:opacity protein-like surface antigen
MGPVCKTLALAGASALASTVALAADFPVPPPPPLAPAPIESSGWYLRGDVGFSNQRVGSIYNILEETAGSVSTLDKGFDAAPLFGGGIGYQWNNWLRFDVTGQYRGNANFHGLQVYTPEPNSGTGVGVDDYHASKSEVLVMANAYVDLGTWWCVTPFIGAGIGASYNTISNFRDINVATNGLAFASSDSKWDLAWALHAGLSYKVTPNFIVELAYSYTNLGDAQSGDLITYNGVSTTDNPEQFRDITSHDITLGVRWLLQPAPVYEPLMSRG